MTYGKTHDKIKHITPPPMPDGVKTCTKCCEDLPSTNDYFDRDESKEDGFRQVCKACRSEMRELAQRERMDDRIKMIDAASMNLLENISRGGSEVPHVAELYQRIMEVFEGAGGYAGDFMAEYLSAKPGSTTRTKMLETIARLSANVSESGAAQLPVELMEDTEIVVQMNKFLGIPYHGPDGEAKEAS